MLAAICCGAAAEEPAGTAGCAPDPALSGTVASVADGRTFMLADGREVRLAAIETPVTPRTAQNAPSEGDAARAAAARAATAALTALISTKTIAMRPLTPANDRYGRLLAHAFITRADGPHSVEADLLAQGHAFVAPRAADPCTAALLATERRARTAKLGLWGDPYYETKSAEEPAAVLAARGRFAIVGGKVMSVRESGGTIYVNFGRRWSEDFTVTISKRNERLFAAAGIAPKTLTGRRVLVRGWVEERGGPWIEATVPAQIETVDGR